MLNYLTLLITLLLSVTGPFAAQAQTSSQVSQQKAETSSTATGNRNATAISVSEQNNEQSLRSSNSPTQPSIYIHVEQGLSNRSTSTTINPSQRSQTPSSQSTPSEQFLIEKMVIESKERIAEQQIESNAKLSVFNRLISDW